MISAGIIGGTGYTGAELMRLLAGHDGVELTVITSRTAAGRSVADLFPSLRGWVDLEFSDPDESGLSQCDVVFSATPNGVAMKQAPDLVDNGVRIIDLAADFRLQDPLAWETWYGQVHTSPELLAEAVYGLPEINRDAIRTARVVANPGCYPTAVQLGFFPLLKAELVESKGLIADAKSGVSGAGRTLTPSSLYCEVADSIKAYAVDGHRHLPEIKQGLERVAGGPVGLTFVPHLTPMIRGIHATLYARLKSRSVDLQTLYDEFYQDSPFVDVMPVGSHPDTGSVRGSNICRLACHRPQSGDVAVILVVQDNLVKGAAGQAVQNMNIMFGLDERAGLLQPALLP